MTSAVNSSPSCSTTVRQTPLTAMESPCCAPSVTTGPRRRKREASPRFSTAVTSPSSSTIPVNTSRVLLPHRARTPGPVDDDRMSGRATRERRRTRTRPVRTGRNRRRRARMPARRALPPIRTLTVGPGISPGQPAAGSDRVADCNRRFGLSPTPECAASGTGPVCHARSTPMRVRDVGWLTERVSGLLQREPTGFGITDQGSTSVTATAPEGGRPIDGRPIDRLGLVLLKSAVAVPASNGPAAVTTALAPSPGPTHVSPGGLRESAGGRSGRAGVCAPGGQGVRSGKVGA